MYADFAYLISHTVPIIKFNYQNHRIITAELKITNTHTHKAPARMRSFWVLVLIQLLMIQCQLFLCVSQKYDFFYFVQQWPGSYCDTKSSCCYPTTGKPAADFGIHGLWPNFNNGSYPSNCKSNSPYDETKISDLISTLQKSWPTISCPSANGTKFWSHEWTKHGTCSESTLDQREYFEAALKLKDKVGLLQILKNAGIKPDDEYYSLDSIKEAIKVGVGQGAAIECNIDASGHSQLYQIYLCADASGTDIIECPFLPKRKCNSSVEFPSFGDVFSGAPKQHLLVSIS